MGDEEAWEVVVSLSNVCLDGAHSFWGEEDHPGLPAFARDVDLVHPAIQDHLPAQTSYLTYTPTGSIQGMDNGPRAKDLESFLPTGTILSPGQW
jgi:hypothetical protein